MALTSPSPASRLAVVHVHDPRVRWGVPAAQVLRILAAAEWVDTPAIDVLATLGPPPASGSLARRVVIVRGAADREAALLALGSIDIADVDSSDVLSLPDMLAANAPDIAAIVVAHDASLSLLLQPSAMITPDDSALREEPCTSRS